MRWFPVLALSIFVAAVGRGTLAAQVIRAGAPKKGSLLEGARRRMRRRRQSRKVTAVSALDLGAGARFLFAGVGKHGAGKHASAVTLLKRVHHAFVLGGWARYYRGISLEALGRRKEALAVLRALAGSKGAGAASDAGREMLATVLHRMKKHEAAAAHLAHLLRRHPRHRLAWEWRLQQANALLAAGKGREARKILFRICCKGPRREARRGALRILLAAWKGGKTPASLRFEERLQWVSVLLEKKEVTEALAVVKALRKRRLGHVHSARLTLLFAKVLQRKRQRSRALMIMRRLARSKAPAGVRAEVETLLAEEFTRKKKYGEAGRRLERAAARYPTAAVAPRALYRASEIYRMIPDWKSTIRVCRRMNKLYPKSWYAAFVTFRHGETLLRLKKSKAAAAVFDQFLKRWPDHRLALAVRWFRTGAWKGVAAKAALRRKELELIAWRSRLSLYAPLAALELASKKGGAKSPRFENRGAVKADLLARRQGLNGKGGWLAPGGTLPLIERRRVDLLRRGGLVTALVWELERLAEVHPKSFAVRNDLALSLFRLRRWGDGVHVAEIALSGRKRFHDYSRSHILRILYPRAYVGLVDRYCREFRLPAAMACAIAREESHWRRETESWSGARGLMQIMPATGKWLAKLLRVKGYALERLYEPRMNLRLGVYYLARLGKKLGARAFGECHVMAAYNGGPGNVRRWIEAFGKDPYPFFLERLHLQETRLYVKKVARSLLYYELLYPETGRLGGSITSGRSGTEKKKRVGAARHGGKDKMSGARLQGGKAGR